RIRSDEISLYRGDACVAAQRKTATQASPLQREKSLRRGRGEDIEADADAGVDGDLAEGHGFALRAFARAAAGGSLLNAVLGHVLSARSAAPAPPAALIAPVSDAALGDRSRRADAHLQLRAQRRRLFLRRLD